MNYKNIVVAIDFSKQSLKALHRAINIAKNNNALLKLVNVVDTKTFGSIAAYDLDYASQLKKEHQDELEKLKNEVITAGVEKVEAIVKEGSPKVVLTSLENVDLIICGETGYNQMEKLMLGSVAERVVRSATCDVLIVR